MHAMVVELDLTEERQAQLAGALEGQQRRFAAIRYGTQFRAGIARVVLNPDAPLAMCNYASSLIGSPEAAAGTLASLPGVWEEAGLHQVFVLDSPASLPELGVVAEEAEYDAVEELSVMLLVDARRLMEGEPGALTRPLPEALEDDVAAVLADAYGYPRRVEDALAGLYGQRLDDPRVLAVGAEVEGRLVGVATAFVEDRMAMVADVGVMTDHRGAGSVARWPARSSRSASPPAQRWCGSRPRPVGGSSASGPVSGSRRRTTRSPTTAGSRKITAPVASRAVLVHDRVRVLTRDPMPSPHTSGPWRTLWRTP
jgi:hypothetical protein